MSAILKAILSKLPLDGMKTAAGVAAIWLGLAISGLSQTLAILPTEYPSLQAIIPQLQTVADYLGLIIQYAGWTYATAGAVDRGLKWKEGKVIRWEPSLHATPPARLQA